MATTTDLFGGNVMSPVVDPYPVYARLRREQPLMPMEMMFGRKTNLVTRRDDVRAVLSDPELFSSKSNAELRFVMGRTILEMDGQEHQRHRNLIMGAMQPRALRGELPVAIREIADHLIDQFAGEGRADLVSDFTFTFPLRVFTQKFLQIPVSDYDQFHRWALELISLAVDPMKAVAAAKSIIDYLQPLLDERKGHHSEDMLTALVNAEIDGEKLGDEELLGFCRLLIPAGAETTYRLIGSAMYALLTHPEQLEEVRADPSLIPKVVEETLRWESSVQYASRRTTEPTTVAGVELPVKAVVTLCLGSANRDEQHYEDPDRFDLHREQLDHLAFGYGRHFCAGAHLARLEARVALEALIDRLPELQLEPDSDAHVVGLAFRSPKQLPVTFKSRA